MTYVQHKVQSLYILLSIDANSALFTAFVRGRRIYSKYVFSTVLAFFFGEFSQVFRWKAYTYFVGKTETVLKHPDSLEKFQF